VFPRFLCGEAFVRLCTAQSEASHQVADKPCRRDLSGRPKKPKKSEIFHDILLTEKLSCPQPMHWEGAGEGVG
ncbi:MAG: hypothetical protein OXG23_13015, partial [Chloroflexi bacterium]|nr:hypothetical protein [Chloroflexota bacterium]